MSKARKQLIEGSNLYGIEPREVPLYSLLQASRYLKIPFGTLRSWVRGRDYPSGNEQGKKFSGPVILLSDPDVARLSFMNLVEAYVLNGIRRVENVPFYKVRNAIKYLEDKSPSKHPLADKLFLTNGVDLFIEDLGQLVNVSRGGQLAIRNVVEEYLRRIDRDPTKLLPVRLYPFLRSPHQAEEPKRVMIDPLVSFGRPVLAKTGVPTAIVAERFYAGDSTDELGRDYGVEREEIEEAVRYEAPARKAA
ncbi:MAG: DUF433 domain-containing protein [Acidobacteria bacterium]|nr:DUF433 domain-containing protein [Acidobacteriota bacterium]MBI3424293.1 DUF433 domain-containing protein [Acidobacteriota bacterium]